MLWKFDGIVIVSLYQYRNNLIHLELAQMNILSRIKLLRTGSRSFLFSHFELRCSIYILFAALGSFIVLTSFKLYPSANSEN